MLPSIDFRRTPAEQLLRPRSIALVGASSPAGERILDNLRRAGFPGTLTAVEHAEELIEGADLGIVAAGLSAGLDAFARLRIGVAVSIALGVAPDCTCRLLGPGSFGVIVPGARLNASLGHLPARSGKLAFVSPSTAMCRTVLDWAEPNAVGFSHVIGTGQEGSFDTASVLDALAREQGVGAILLDVRTVRDRRAFLSAARAAAGARPVVALHAGTRQADPTGRADRAFQAALRRVGVLPVETMAELLAAAEILTRTRAPRNDRLAIVANAVGAGQLAADQASRLGIPLAAPDPANAALLQLHLPPQPTEPGLIWTGDEQPIRAAETVAMLSALPEIGGIAVVLAPTGPADAAATAALAAAQSSLKVPLLACVLGETTGAVHRRTLAEAGIAAFATPEQTVRAFGQIVAQRRAKAAARELPASRVLRLAPDHGSVRRTLDLVRRDGRAGLFQNEALDVLSAYGMPAVPFRPVESAAEAGDAAALLGFPATVKRRRLDPDAAGVLVLGLPDKAAVQAAAEGLGGGDGLLVQREVGRAQRLRLTVHDDALVGPVIGFGPGGRDRDREAAFELPPMNLSLARQLIARSAAAGLLGEGQGHRAANLDAIADALVRVSQLVIDTPEIEQLRIDPLFADPDGVSAAEAWIKLRPQGQMGRTAISPFPVELQERWAGRDGRSFEIRPIRPEDADAHIAFIARLTPEDVRYRFFSVLRELPPEQIVRMTQIDYDREMAIIATNGETTFGVARLVEALGGRAAEFAVVVDRSVAGNGLGRRLMDAIIGWGRSRGIGRITGQVLADNARMLHFVRGLGFDVRRDPDDPTVVEAELLL